MFKQRVLETMVGRPRRSWAELVELAECAWQYLPKEEVHDERGGYTGRLARERSIHGKPRTQSCSHTAVLAELVEAIMDFGNGEKTDPKMSPRQMLTRAAA